MCWGSSPDQLLALENCERSKLQGKTAPLVETCRVKDPRGKVFFIIIWAARGGKAYWVIPKTLPSAQFLLRVSCSQICLCLWVRDGRKKLALTAHPWTRSFPYISLKLEIELLYNPAIPLLGIHTEEARTIRDTCTPMFIAALFTIARTWKQPRCPLADEWIRKLWYIYTMEYYSAIKKNAFEPVLMRWIKLEPVIKNEESQKEKHQYSILTHIYGI